MNPLTVFVDVDSVVADLPTAWLNAYNKDYDDHLTPNDLDTWALDHLVKPECSAHIYDYLEDPRLYDNVLPILGAVDGVRTLRQMGHRIIFATSSPNGSAGRKLTWLYDHGFLTDEHFHRSTSPDYIEIHDKSLLRGDVLIDDGPHNVKFFHGYAILFRHPHNQSFEWPAAVENWAQVVGTFNEGIPVGSHITEITRPTQTRAFLDLMERMYRVHLDKNADYSPANILGCGEIGLMTRVWDKVSRLMNLMGFKLDVELKEFAKPMLPKNESIDDNVMDLAVYSIIWQLYRAGKWGK